MKLEVFPVGYISTNCVLIYDDTQREAVVVDPGRGFERISARVAELGKRVTAVLLTHGHWDHILDVKRWQASGARIYIDAADADKLYTDKNRASLHGIDLEPTTADICVSDGDSIEVGALKFRVLHSPGHTAGSCVYLIESVMLAGDTLFYESYGRTDFPDGSFSQIKQSLQKLFKLQDDYRVIPGHGPETTLNYEKCHNPILRG